MFLAKVYFFMKRNGVSNPKVLTPRTKRNYQKLLGAFSKIDQGLIGWGTLIFRLVNLHTDYEKSI